MAAIERGRDCNRGARDRRQERIGDREGRKQERNRKERQGHGLVASARDAQHAEKHDGQHQRGCFLRRIPDAQHIPAPRVPGRRHDERDDEIRTHHATICCCRCRHMSQVSAAQAMMIRAHSCGSGTVGTVGTVDWLTGVSRAASYCCLFSSTTAPLTGVTKWYWLASLTASTRLPPVRISSSTRSCAHSRAMWSEPAALLSVADP